MCVIFFFKQKTAYEMRISDWSSDVCSSDLDGNAYVRYLAIKCLESTDAPLDWETLASDPSDLVRYSRLERNKHFQHSPTEDLELASPEHFFALPQAARLAVLRSLVTDLRAVAELVTYVLDQPLSARVVSENE